MNNDLFGMRKECSLLQSNFHTRTTKEAEETIEKQRRKRRIIFSTQMSNLGTQCRHSNILNSSTVFEAIRHVTIPSWSLDLSSSDLNLIISHGDIPPTIQTPASSVTMESTFSLEHFSTIAADLDYVLLLRQPLPEFLCTAWHISSQPAPSVPLVLGQHVLVSPASRTYFGHLKSIVRLEDSYLVISVSPESSAYGRFIPESCHIHLPPSFISLPWRR